MGDGVWVWGDEDHLEEEEEGEGDDRQREEAHLASKTDRNQSDHLNDDERERDQQVGITPSLAF